MMEPDGWNVTDSTTTGAGFTFTGPVLKTGTGQSLKVRGYIKAGAGSVIIDVIYLFPMTGAYNHMWDSGYQYVIFPPYGTDNDGWVYPGYGGFSSPYGWNGAFPASYYGLQVAVNFGSSAVTSAPDPNAGSQPVFAVGGMGGLGVAGGGSVPQTIWLSARCTDPAHGVGKIRALTWPTGDPGWTAGSTEYDVPADGNVYLVALDSDPVSNPDTTDNYGFQIWAPDADQRIRVDLIYVNAADPPPPVGPVLKGRFRLN
jgi:hypothetical protein